MLKHVGEFKLSESDIGKNGNIKAASLMYEFQEIAAKHATLLNLGFDKLMVNNYIWVMTKLRFKTYMKFKAGESYTLETYPRPKKGVSYFRDYYVYDSQGTLMAAGMSQWCIINFDTRRIERAKIDFDGEYIDKAALEDGIGKIKVTELRHVGYHKVVESDLDRNQHTNNCRYADMIEDVVDDEAYSDFTINFSKEALLNDLINLYEEKNEDKSIVVGKLEDDTIIFQAEIK